MVSVFLAVVNMSITATVVAALLLIIRLLFGKKMPSVYCYLLWGVLFFRLLVPFSVVSRLSFFNLMPNTHTETSGEYVVVMDYTLPTQNQILVEEPFFNYENLKVLSIIWITITILFLTYACFTYIRAVAKLKTAIWVKDCPPLQYCMEITKTAHRRVRVFTSTLFESPVVIGAFRPRIIIPPFIDLKQEKQLVHIITHELIHIKRHDQITKFITTFALILHWFNPVVWLCYKLYLEDIETACDENVLKILGEEQKKGYAQSLIDFSALQQKFSMVKLAFSESHLKHRIIGVAKYKKLGRFQVCCLLSFVLLIGVVTTTNPVLDINEYVPKNFPVSKAVYNAYQSSAMKLVSAIDNGDLEMMAQLANTTDPYYIPLYSWMKETDMYVDNCRLFTQDDGLAYCYLDVVSQANTTVLQQGKNQLVAVLQRDSGQVTLKQLQPKQWFDCYMLVEDTEPVQLIRNLHSFDIYTGFGTGKEVRNAQIAAFCINEEYLDRTKSGELSPDDVYIKPEWVQYAAKRYFGLDGFSYTFDETLYDAEKQLYIYNPNQKSKPNATIVKVDEQSGEVVITAQIYKDPLQMVLDKTVTYILLKDRG